MSTNVGTPTVALQQGRTRRPRKKRSTTMRKHRALYFMVIPGLVWFIMFRAIPMGGILIAFQDYNIFRGFLESEWVGLKHFRYLFQYQDFYRVFYNSLIIAIQEVLIGFPAPIILALALNEVRRSAVKRSLQTVLYLPYFFSWVMIAALFFQILSINGIVNQIIAAFGGERVLLVQREWFFRPMIILSGLYRNSGYGTIIYLAAIAGIDPQLYEAAMIDGANRFQRILLITFPSILPTALVLLLLRIGGLMNFGFDRIYNFLTPMTFGVGDVFDTYVFRVGLTEGQYSLTTAIGLFQGFVAFAMVWVVNRMMRRQGGGLW